MLQSLAFCVIYLFTRDGIVASETRVVAKRIHGRLLATRIQPGMTMEQVNRVVASGGGAEFRTIHSFWVRYRDYGFGVWYGMRPDGNYTVRRVDFAPLITSRELHTLSEELQRRKDLDETEGTRKP